MNKLIMLPLFIFMITSYTATGQNGSDLMKYEPSAGQPFGTINPEAPEETAQFSFMVGKFDCQSEQRNQDESWQEAKDMIWSSKYFLNGYGIQDYAWWAKNSYATSTRLYDEKNDQWVVTFFSMPNFTGTPGTWFGGKSGDKMILKRDMKSPGGREGVSRLTFYDISENGYKWIGEWISKDGSVVYPFWKITCEKRTSN